MDFLCQQEVEATAVAATEQSRTHGECKLCNCIDFSHAKVLILG